MPQPFLEFSLQSFPLTKVAHPSRGHMLPCSQSPTCRTPPCHRSLPVSSTSTHLRSCPIPLAAMDSLLAHRSRPPACPRLPRPNSSFPSAPPTSKRSSFRESVHANLGCPKPTVDPLLGFTLSRALPLVPRVLDPLSPTRGLNTLSHPKNPEHDSKDARPFKPGCDASTRNVPRQPHRQFPIP
jgi:hypothetical protein